MEVHTLSKTIVDEVEYTLATCDARYVLNEYADPSHLAGLAHYEVRVTRVDEAATRLPSGGKCHGTIIGAVSFPFTAEGGQAARSTYALLIECAHVPLARLADGLLPKAEVAA